MSLHTNNAAVAIANHRVYFGEATGIEYRASKECPWATLEGAVLHGEFVANVRKGNTFAKVTKRHLFCDASQVSKRINAQVRVGGDCGDVYTVTDITTRSAARYQLHLQRADIVEYTRPGYRKEDRP